MGSQPGKLAKSKELESAETIQTLATAGASDSAPANSSSQPESPQDLDVERIARAWRALMAYRGLSLQVFDTQALSYSHLPENRQAMIPNVPVRLSHAADAVEHNADLLERIASLTGISTPFLPEETDPVQLDQTVADFPDVVDTILAVMRDWSSDGEKDRARLFDVVISAVKEAADEAASSLLATDDESNPVFSVLVIGASLGRLAWELARLGFSVQGVESSYLQLFAANFILNGTSTPENPLHLCPFVHHTGMVASADEQLRRVLFPDIDPRLLESTDFSMVAGEFLALYEEADYWDCVVTCFSLESAHSVISYVRRIAKVLKVGGVWVNHGSLDFRYDDSEAEPSIEITLEELEFVIARAGMRVLRRDSRSCRPPYVVNGMVSEECQSTFFVAVKV